MNWDYVAGFFDGEGCIGFYTTKKDYEYAYRMIPKGRKVQIISISQKTRPVLEEIHSFLVSEGINSAIHEIKRVFQGKIFSLYELNIKGQKGRTQFLKKIESKLIVKRSKAYDALKDLGF
jgi:intein/homing endonuclease